MLNQVPKISVLVLTLNEEVNIADCLASLSGFDDVHVLDSGSTDKTLEIAASLGVPVYHHEFTGFGDQRNWAIDNIPFKYAWHLHLDADERMTPGLAGEMQDELAKDASYGGYFIASKLMFGDKWLRYAGDYPTYQVRLFRPDRLRFVNHGHGQREVSEHPVGKLKNAYLHYAFRKGLDDWFAKHARYANREARARRESNVALKNSSLLCGDAVQRRRALRQATDNLPCRYFMRLTYMLFLKRAFLDGKSGLIYAHMLAIYEAMIEVYGAMAKERIQP